MIRQHAESDGIMEIARSVLWPSRAFAKETSGRRHTLKTPELTRSPNSGSDDAATAAFGSRSANIPLTPFTTSPPPVSWSAAAVAVVAADAALDAVASASWCAGGVRWRLPLVVPPKTAALPLPLRRRRCVVVVIVVVVVVAAAAADDDDISSVWVNIAAVVAVSIAVRVPTQTVDIRAQRCAGVWVGGDAGETRTVFMLVVGQ